MENCPNCGADLPRNARVCPECGSDEETGWSDEAAVSGLGLPDESFNYDEFVKREFEGKPPVRHKFRSLWTATAIVLILLFLGTLVYYFVHRAP